jgi:hypothetical protein
MHNCICICKLAFHRGHETCPSLNIPDRLSRTQQESKERMQLELYIQKRKFTDIDYLINSKQLRDAGIILSYIRDQLKQVYRVNQMVDL